MGFPEQERFTVEDLAGRWQKSSEYIAEQISSLQFTHITLVEKIGGGSLLTRHLYFDKATWKKDYGKQIEDLQKKAERNAKEHYERVLAGAKASRNKHIKLLEKRIKTDLRTVHVSKTSYKIGPDEVANLWEPWPPRHEWRRKEEHVQVYITRSAVESFERKHAIQQKGKTERAEKADRDPLLDLSAVISNRWYFTFEAARFLGMQQKYLQNDLIPNGKLPAKRVGKRYVILGEEIRNYAKKYSPKS